LLPCGFSLLSFSFFFSSANLSGRNSTLSSALLPSLLQGRRSLEANQTLHDVRLSLRYYTIYTFSEALAPDRILPSAIFTLRPSLAFSYIVSYCTYVGVTARHSSSGHQSNFAAWYKEWNKLPNFRRGRHLYSAGRPSRWASAVILVTIVVLFVCHNCSYCDFVTTV